MSDIAGTIRRLRSEPITLTRKNELAAVERLTEIERLQLELMNAQGVANEHWRENERLTQERDAAKTIIIERDAEIEALRALLREWINNEEMANLNDSGCANDDLLGRSRAALGEE